MDSGQIKWVIAVSEMSIIDKIYVLWERLEGKAMGQRDLLFWGFL